MWKRQPYNFHRDYRKDWERDRIDAIAALISELQTGSPSQMTIMRSATLLDEIERWSFQVAWFSRQVYEYRDLLRDHGIEDTVRPRFDYKIPGDG